MGVTKLLLSGTLALVSRTVFCGHLRCDIGSRLTLTSAFASGWTHRPKRSDIHLPDVATLDEFPTQLTKYANIRQRKCFQDGDTPSHLPSSTLHLASRC